MEFNFFAKQSPVYCLNCWKTVRYSLNTGLINCIIITIINTLRRAFYCTIAIYFCHNFKLNQTCSGDEARVKRVLVDAENTKATFHTFLYFATPTWLHKGKSWETAAQVWKCGLVSVLSVAQGSVTSEFSSPT